MKETISTKERIIKSAMELLSEGGPDAFTANSLIKKADISKGALYHHFRSLDEVLVAVLNQRIDSKIFIPRMKLDKYKNLSEYLADFFINSIEITGRKSFLSFLLFYNQKSIYSNDFREKMSCISQLLFDYLCGTIQHFYKKQIETEKLKSIASLIIFTLEGVSAHSFMHQDKNKFQGSWNLLIKNITHELEDYK